MGETSIKVYRLFRDELVEERRREQANVIAHLMDRFSQRDIAAVATKIGDCWTGKERYSAALRAAITHDERTALLVRGLLQPTASLAAV
jgi:hypothetical protein